MAFVRLTSDATDEDIERALDNHAPPFEALEQVESFINAASLYLRRTPAEFSRQGHSSRAHADLSLELADAKRWRAIYRQSRRSLRAARYLGADP